MRHASFRCALFYIALHQIPSFLVTAFAPSHFIRNPQGSHFFRQHDGIKSCRVASPTSLHLSQVSSSNESSVGIVGRGFVFVLAAKLAALAGYNTWMLYPPNEYETIESLIKNDDDESLPANLDLMSTADEAGARERLTTTDALILAVDAPDNGVLDPSVVDFLINADSVASLKRVVIMSRNLNGSGMGFFVNAAKVSANSQIWAAGSEQIKAYQDYESLIKSNLRKAGSDADVVTVRVGTLKGGACGEDPFYPQYLSKKFYEITKTDIITWNYLFDLNVRGVELVRGDNLPGPGLKAVFTATSPEVCDGDSSRCAVAEAMVRCLSVDSQNNDDGGEFGVKTREGREPPKDEEWDEMLKKVMSS